MSKSVGVANPSYKRRHTDPIFHVSSENIRLSIALISGRFQLENARLRESEVYAKKR